MNITERCENLDYLQWNETIMVNVTTNTTTTSMHVESTWLKKNRFYYNIYCIGINSMFSSIFPFFALMFFNISIALELKSNNRQPNFFITYLRCGRAGSPDGGMEGVGSPTAADPRNDVERNSSQRSSKRQNGGGHKLCVRFTGSRG
jgi:hypothetical protein